jgi:hypothetical protein
MGQSNDLSYRMPFTSDSSPADGLHVFAALGGGSPHRVQVDTGSVGILVPRHRLGPDYQDFDPSQDTKFGYVSSGKGIVLLWRVPGSSPPIILILVWPLSDHGSLRGRRVPPHDGVGSVGLVTSRTRSI